MTDSSNIFSLPEEIINLIAQYLTPEELAQFRQTCKLFYKVGAEASLLQPHYNRLRTLDPSLPVQLPRESAPQAFKDAFEKVRAAQVSEIKYLSSHHDIAKYPYLNHPLSPVISLEQLENRSAELDKINSDIIGAFIDTNLKNQYNQALYLNSKRITRIPLSLIRDKKYAQYWQNLTILSCNDNKLSALNLQGCTALLELYSGSNQLTNLNVQGCTALQELYCYNNQLTNLNLAGLSALLELYCYNNKLSNLNLKGCTALQTLDYEDNPLSLASGASAYLTSFGSSALAESQGRKRLPEEDIEVKTDNESKEQKAPERKKSRVDQ